MPIYTGRISDAITSRDIMSTNDDVDELRHLFAKLDEDGSGLRSAIQYLFHILTLLDSKSAAGLIMNSIIFAALTIFFTSQERDPAVLWASVAGAVFALVSSALLVYIVLPHWLDKRNLTPEEYLAALWNLSDRRTQCCRIGFVFIGLALLALIADFFDFVSKCTVC